MTQRHDVRLRERFLATFLCFQGVFCELTIVPPGPTFINAIAGTNVTLAVSLSGAPDPAITWTMGALPVVVWTIGSDIPPDIPDIHQPVLKIEPNGSLTFKNIQLSYSNKYTVDITKSGVGTATAVFMLMVYEVLQNVTVSLEPDFAEEGTDSFSLRFSTLQGEAVAWRWYFNGMEIKYSSHYSVEQGRLVIKQPRRNDTGLYSLVLTNPFSSVRAHKNVTVFYGPDEPVLAAIPRQSFYEAGVSLSLSCQAEGNPEPLTHWLFGDQTLPASQGGVFNLINASTSQAGTYTCVLLNEKTGTRLEKKMQVQIYESPMGSPLCSVNADGNSKLQFQCQWPGGTPMAQLSFPALANSSAAEIFNVTTNASQDLNGQTGVCMAYHPLRQKQCNFTTRSPVEFLPMVETTVDMDGKIVITIHCQSEALPKSVVSWSEGGQGLTNGTGYQISGDTTQLSIRGVNISSHLRSTYTCNCSNPLGSQSQDTQLLGPTISDSGLFPNQDGTVITLTWEVPPTSVVTGFDIQMMGPDLPSNSRNSSQTKGVSGEFRSIQRKPGSVRSTDVYSLDPKSTYSFRIVPNAGRMTGQPSGVHMIGPGGLTSSAIAGIAAGIPCGLLFLLLLIGLVYLCVLCWRKKRRQTRYPLSRAVEKPVATQPDKSSPRKILTEGLKAPPDYNRSQLSRYEKSVTLPMFVPPPPVRFATTV
ncbi:V-set and immunoglobulin domain-containing protein 10-like [Aplochiton taeniatus]